MKVESFKFTKYIGAHQETRWAQPDDVKAATERIDLREGSYKAAGLPIVNDGQTAYVDNTDTHSLILGATGSKKTRLFCMPMLHIMIGAGESFIATDPKGELYHRTSGHAKAMGYDVVVLNFRDLSLGDTWNPLALPFELYHKGQKDEAIARLNDFVSALAEPSAANSKDAFWVNAAKSVSLSILILMMDMCTAAECNLHTFSRFCVEFASGTTERLYAKAAGLEGDEVATNYLTDLMELTPRDSLAWLNYAGIAGSSDRARCDVQSTLFTLVQVFMTQERLVRNLSSNSFDIRDAGQKKTAIYLIVPDEKTTFHFIATTFIKQSYETLILEAQKCEDRQLPMRVNFVLDEFANIPTIPDMPSMITAARSRNMRFYLVVQSMHQLRKRYQDEAQTIKGNCDNWVFLTSKEIELLHEISKLSGEIHSYGERGLSRPLISISQLQRLNKQKGETLIFCGRQYPFITEIADIDDCAFPKHPPMPFQKVGAGKVESVGPKEMYRSVLAGSRHKPFKKPMGKPKLPRLE